MAGHKELSDLLQSVPIRDPADDYSFNEAINTRIGSRFVPKEYSSQQVDLDDFITNTLLKLHEDPSTVDQNPQPTQSRFRPGEPNTSLISRLDPNAMADIEDRRLSQTARRK